MCCLGDAVSILWLSSESMPDEYFETVEPVTKLKDPGRETAVNRQSQALDLPETESAD